MAITISEKHTLILSLIQSFDEVNGAWNVNQGNLVMLCAWRICQGGFTHNQSLLQSNKLKSRLNTKFWCTVMNLSFWTDRSGQTVQIQIRLLLEEQSDQGLRCSVFYLHHFDKIPKVWLLCLKFRSITGKIFGVPNFRNFSKNHRVCLNFCS